MRLVGPSLRPILVTMTIHKDFVILSAVPLSLLDDNTRRMLTYANLRPFKKRVRRVT